MLCSFPSTLVITLISFRLRLLHDCLLDFPDIDAEVGRDCGQRPPGVEHRHHCVGLIWRYHRSTLESPTLHYPAN
jgi:hypothetical protein